MTSLVRMVFQCLLLWEGIKGQAGLQIALKTLNGTGIDLIIPADKSCYRLVSHLSIFLREQSLQLLSEAFLLFVGKVGEDIVHLVNHTVLAGRARELAGNSIEHGLVAITDPQIDAFEASGFKIGE